MSAGEKENKEWSHFSATQLIHQYSLEDSAYDDEVFRRDRERRNGVVEPLSHEEFIRRVEEARKQ